MACGQQKSHRHLLGFPEASQTPSSLLSAIPDAVRGLGVVSVPCALCVTSRTWDTQILYESVP